MSFFPEFFHTLVFFIFDFGLPGFLKFPLPSDELLIFSPLALMSALSTLIFPAFPLLVSSRVT